MPTVSKSTDIPAPPEKIWETIVDTARSAEWQTIHQGYAGDVPETLETGSAFTQKITIMGMPGEVSWTVSEADAPKRLEMAGAGPMGTTATMVLSLEPSNGGTSVNIESGFEGAVLTPMAGPLEAQSAKDLDSMLEKLKGLVS